MRNPIKQLSAFLPVALVLLLVASVAYGATVRFPATTGKGQLVVGSSTAEYANLPTSTNGLVLTASSTAPRGVSWEAAPGSSSGISSLNGATSTTQTFATSTGGTAFSITSATSSHVFNFPTSPTFTVVSSTGITATNATTSGNLQTGTFKATGAVIASSSLTVSGTATFQGDVLLPTGAVSATAGAVSVKTTSSTLNFSTGAAEQVLSPLNSFDFTIENPTASEDDSMHLFRVTSTIVRVMAVHKSAGDTSTFNLVWGPSRNTAAASSRHLFAANSTSTSTSTPDIYTTFASSTVDASTAIRLVTSAASSSQWTITVYYQDNP